MTYFEHLERLEAMRKDIANSSSDDLEIDKELFITVDEDEGDYQAHKTVKDALEYAKENCDTGSNFFVFQKVAKVSANKSLKVKTYNKVRKSK